MTRTFRYSLIVGAGVMAILLLLLATAAENTRLFEQNYSWLLSLNILVAAALFTLVCFMLIRLFRRYQRGRFGSVLMTRLVFLFALIGTLPGLVIYTVSFQFVSRSIETWFDVRVEAALSSGVKLGQNILESSLSNLNAQAEQLSQDLSVLTLSEQMLLLSRLSGDKNHTEAMILTSSGHIIATSSTDFLTLLPNLPTPAMLRQTGATSRYSAIEESAVPDPENPGASEGGALQLRVIIPIPKAHRTSFQKEIHFLQLLQPVSPSLAMDAEALRIAYSEYQVRSLSRSGLRKIYIVTLTLTLLLAIFAAIAAAFQIASNLTRPLLLLSQGTKAISEGDLSPRPSVESTDELGTLIQSFNEMTLQLADAREQTEKSRTDLETAKAYLESVLANMSAGVIVLDHTFRLVSCNESVERILFQDLNPHIGETLHDIENLNAFSTPVIEAFSELSIKEAAHGSLNWQRQIEIPHLAPGDEEAHDVMLLARGSRLPVEGQSGYIVVFDDVTDIISAQRSLAWGEVARRLAHEIKNPLTPIQLSAERLQMKLEHKLEPADTQFLAKSIHTIVDQVDAMKRMVSDFRNYAQSPTALLVPLNLNSLVEDIVHLYIGDNTRDIIHLNLYPDLPEVLGDASQLRQVIHNLLQNALDAVTEVNFEEENGPFIEVITEKVTYHNAANEICLAVRLSVVDNGQGFPQKMLSRIFEPYATTKEKGTGLGMAVVKKIVDEHQGRIDVRNRQKTNGAIVSILLVQLVPETSLTKPTQTA